jgi:hypothetical protein
MEYTPKVNVRVVPFNLMTRRTVSSARSFRIEGRIFVPIREVIFLNTIISRGVQVIRFLRSMLNL